MGGLLMKRKFIALFITLVLTFAFSANCFALPSPTEKPIKPTTSQTVTVKPASDKDGNWSKGDKKGLTFVTTLSLIRIQLFMLMVRYLMHQIML